MKEIDFKCIYIFLYLFSRLCIVLEVIINLEWECIYIYCIWLINKIVYNLGFKLKKNIKNGFYLGKRYFKWVLNLWLLGYCNLFFVMVIGNLFYNYIFKIYKLWLLN